MPTRRIRRKVRRQVKRKIVTAYEKGHLFEDVVEKYFELLGYRVEKNVKIRGLSGAVHEIDVLLSKDGEKGVVEAKNYNKPIPKEWVMKASSVAKDVGATQVFVVSASGFTPDATKVAEVLGVKLLVLDDMIKDLKKNLEATTVPVFHVKPKCKENKVKELAFKHVEKRFFKPIEEVGEIELIYYPFYVFEVEFTYVEESGVLFTKEIKKKMKLAIVTSALKPAVAVIGDSTTQKSSDIIDLISTVREALVIDAASIFFMEISSITKEEAELLKVIDESEEPPRIKDLEKELKWSREKISRLLSSLEEKGLVERETEESDTGRTVNVYYSNIPSLSELGEAGKLLAPENVLEPGAPSGYTVDPRIASANILTALMSLYDNLEIHNRRLVYIPIYRVKMYSIKDDTYRYLYISASTEDPVLLENLDEV